MLFTAKASSSLDNVEGRSHLGSRHVSHSLTTESPSHTFLVPQRLTPSPLSHARCPKPSGKCIYHTASRIRPTARRPIAHASPWKCMCKRACTHCMCIIHLLGLEAADDGANYGLAVTHLFDTHFLKGLHELLLTVRTSHDLLEQLHRRHLLLLELLDVLLHA